MRRIPRLYPVLIGLVAVLLPTAVFAQDPGEGRGGRAELRFMEGMIDHHQMALDMAGDCLVRAINEDVLMLCGNIIEAQSAEIELLQGWLLDWYNVDYQPLPMMSEPEPADDDTSAGGHLGHHPEATGTAYADPAMTMGMMAGLSRLEGIAYEVAWLEAMIDHHDDALHMAERLLRRVERADLEALARQIIADQTAEIEHMEALIAMLLA